MQNDLEDFFNGICCGPIVEPFNFDVDSSNWAGLGITDQATFGSYYGVTTDYFVLSATNIKANITICDINFNLLQSNITAVRKLPNLVYTTLNLYNNQISVFTAELASTITTINLSVNQLTSFNPISWPIGLQNLQIAGNLLTQFNPTALMPNTVVNINLGYNQFNTAGYIASEPWANSLHSTTAGNIFIDSNTNSASGTNLESILVGKGWSVVG